MNMHRTFGFLAALLVTVSQIVVFATDTATAARTTGASGGHEYSLAAAPRAAGSMTGIS